MSGYNISQVVAEVLGQGELVEASVYTLHCPLHNDHNPSFILYSDGRWRCYGCPDHGNIWQLVQKMMGCDLWDTLEILSPFWGAGKSVLDTAVVTVGRSDEVTDLERYTNNLRLATDIWQGFTPHPGMLSDWTSPTHEAQHYLFSRGYLADTLDRYHVVVWPQMKHYPIMVPLTLNDDVYGYMCRTTNSRIEPKYLSMEGLKKQQHIYGRIHSKHDVVLITEGRLDGMMASQYVDGINEVSILGSQLSDEQIQEILAWEPAALVSGFDMDRAGRLASKQLRIRMRPYNVPIIDLTLLCKDIGGCSKEEFLTAWHLAIQSAIIPRQKVA